MLGVIHKLLTAAAALVNQHRRDLIRRRGTISRFDAELSTQLLRRTNLNHVRATYPIDSLRS